MGMLVAGLFVGSWWLVCISGLVILMMRRSYIVLFAGVILDLVFFSFGTPVFFVGFYTLLFLIATIIFEYVRTRLLWTS